MRDHRATLFVASTLLTAVVAGSPAAEAELRRRQHAQFCFAESDFIDDYYTYGFGGVVNIKDGRINNQSDLIGARPRDLWCPILSDSHMPHAELDSLLVHGLDDDDKTDVQVVACVSRFDTALYNDCSPVAYSSGADGGPTSDVTYVGAFGIEVDLGVLNNRAYSSYWGYPFLVITLPKNQQGTRIAGYEQCISDGSGDC